VGLDSEGYLQWTNCDSGETYVIARFNKTSSTENVYYFMLLDDASWNLYDETSGQLIWKKECLKPVKPYPHCLSHPDLNCPYLHLHNDGVIVLNWIDSDGVWISRDARRPNIYQDFFEDIEYKIADRIRGPHVCLGDGCQGFDIQPLPVVEASYSDISP
jgi:hypothetical protein